MSHSTLISAAALQALLATPGADVLVVDARFDLADVHAGRRAHDAGHLPGAPYVHLDETLSSAKTGLNGRHPLPSREDFARAMALLGVNNDTQVVVYDNTGGMFAARLWWMLRWAGHAAVAVLDGGLSAWTASGGALEAGTPTPRPAGDFSLKDSLVGTVDRAQVLAELHRGERLVVDARAPDRYRGENETLDPVGGHIPGSLNRFFRDNLAPDGCFKSAEMLRTEFEALIGPRAPSTVVHQCGSGVTACHNLLAMEVAGLMGAALYPGSWSEWCAHPGAPVATGAGA